jgi:hypothetical protein
VRVAALVRDYCWPLPPGFEAVEGAGLLKGHPAAMVPGAGLTG